MADWAPDLLEDDLALEVEETYLDELTDRHDPDQAAAATLEEFDDLLDDEDAAPVVYLALAVVQVDRGPVSPRVREAALNVIDSGVDLDLLDDDDDDDDLAAGRHARLVALAARLRRAS